MSALEVNISALIQVYHNKFWMIYWKASYNKYLIKKIISRVRLVTYDWVVYDLDKSADIIDGGISECSYFLIYHNMTRTMVSLIWTCFEVYLQLSMCLRTMQINLIILFIAFGSSVITATGLKCSSSKPPFRRVSPIRHKTRIIW